MYNVTIQCPRCCVLVEGHVKFGSSYYYLRLPCIELDLVFMGIVADYVQCCLQTAGRAGQQVGHEPEETGAQEGTKQCVAAA